jgi:hypothetical protein
MANDVVGVSLGEKDPAKIAFALGQVAERVRSGPPVGSVTYAQIQNVSATARVLGRKTAGAGVVEECTLSDILDFIGAPANGDILYRTGGVWARLPIGSNGNVLAVTSNLPSWTAAAITAIRVQRFTASGTYTPNANTLYAIMEAVGGGGSGAGGTGPATGFFVGGGGGSGGYSRAVQSLASIGASQTVTIGAGGTAPAAGNNNGGAGGDTSVGTLCVGKGGSGGIFASTGQVATGGAGGASGTGNVENNPGNPGQAGAWATVANVLLLSGAGGNSRLGAGAPAQSQSGAGTTSTGAAAAANTGGGGGGGDANSTTSTFAGGNGGTGLVIITEFCSA